MSATKIAQCDFFEHDRRYTDFGTSISASASANQVPARILSVPAEIKKGSRMNQVS